MKRIAVILEVDQSTVNRLCKNGKIRESDRGTKQQSYYQILGVNLIRYLEMEE